MSRLKERLVDRSIDLLMAVKDRLERAMARHSKVGDRRFFDAVQFAWVSPIEADWKKVRAELDEVLARREAVPNFQDISSDQACLTNDDRWKTFFLYGYGFKADANCARCPQTARIVEAIPGMTTAFFSILGPRKHIPPHDGPYKGVLRYHLGVRIPEPAEACGITVGGETRHWREGGSLVFDDTYEHEAWNETDEDRVVLFVDVERPLPFPLSVVNRLVIKAIGLSPFVQDGKKKLGDFEERFQALERRTHAPVVR